MQDNKRDKRKYIKRTGEEIKETRNHLSKQGSERTQKGIKEASNQASGIQLSCQPHVGRSRICRQLYV